MSNLEMREGEYGDKVMAVEPGGIEAIPDKDRHGKASQLFATWMSPNLEFATIYVGALGVFFGLSFTQAVIGILIGNFLGAFAQYILTQDGSKYGVPQMVIGRAAFGKLGNILPSIFNAGAAGIGWFAVNSVSGAFALASLTKLSNILSLLIVVLIQVTIAFIGHNLVQTVEKYLMPYLIVVFGIAAVITMSKSHLATHGKPFPGAFLVFVGAVYGYAAGWNPFSADYARYLPKSEDPKKTGRFAAAGLFISTTVLQIVGAAAVTAGMRDYGAKTNPVADFTDALPGWLAKAVLLGIVIGSICANVLNIYSGSMSFLTIGFKLGSHQRRAIASVVFGVLGFLLARSAMNNPANNYENFLLVMSYWIGPWLGVMAADKVIRKGASIERLLFADRENPAGPIAFIIGVVVSIWLFANQKYYTGVVPKHNGNFGDLAFPVGFALAFAIYFAIGRKKVLSEK
ncbi:MAG: cytosine permease [Actinomycetes bacterium]